MIGVQASICAPLKALYSRGHAVSDVITGNSTLAEGVNVQNPIRGEEVIRAIRTSRGEIYAVDEKNILVSRDKLAKLGFYVEPTSAIVWPALEKMIRELSDPIVVILTGSGYKYE